MKKIKSRARISIFNEQPLRGLDGEEGEGGSCEP